MEIVQHYETQIISLQEELGTLRQDFESEREAFQQLQSGDLAQSIRQELQVRRASGMLINEILLSDQKANNIN